MSAPIQINLAEIPDARWTEREERCADCRRFFDEIADEHDGNDDGPEVTLLLWKKGDSSQMLRLCLACATKRMKT